MNWDEVIYAAHEVADAALMYRTYDRKLNNTEPETAARLIYSTNRRRAKRNLFLAVDAYIEARERVG